MATTKLTLTTDWQLVSIKGFIGQCRQRNTVLITNSTGTPSTDAPAHAMLLDDSLQFSAPASGEWYAKLSKITPNTDASLIVTELV